MFPPEGHIDEIYSPKRAEDFSTVARIASFAMKWQWIIWLIAITMLAFGFDFKTPSQKFAEVESAVIANRNVTDERINNVESRLNDQDRRMSRALAILEGLAIDACERLQGNKYARSQLACERKQQQ